MRVSVIGSGVSGLVTAAYLARAGHTVTVFEQAATAGGVTAGAALDGFRWDSGQLNLEGFLPGEPCGRVLEDLGIADRVQPVREDRAVVYPDFAIRRPENYGGLWWRRELLEGIFPEERRGIARYYALYRRMSKVMHLARLLDRAAGPQAFFLKARLFATLLPVFHWRNRTAAELSGRFFRSEKLRAVFLSMLADFSVRPSQFPGLGLPAINPEAAYDRRMPPGPFSGPSYTCLRGGMQSLVEALCASVESSGGRIRTNATVEGLDFADGRPAALVVNGGREPTDLVVASGGAREFFDRLPPQLIPQSLAARLRELPLMQSIFLVHLGVDLDVTRHQKQVTSYYINTYDIERGIEDLEAGRFHEGRDGFVIHIPSLLSPEMAPPGKHSVTIYTVAPDRLASGDWQSKREEFAVSLITQAERFVPGLLAATKARVILTPDDFRRRTHLDHHAFGGLAPTLGRPGIPHATGLPGVWFVGAQSESGGGVNNGMLGAFRTARRILEAVR